MEDVKKRGRKKGYKPSAENVFNMRIAQKKRFEEEDSICGVDIKPVVQLSRKDGSFIARYNNVKEALIAIGKPTNRSDISHCCKGIRNRKSAFGFAWKYEEEYLKLDNINN